MFQCMQVNKLENLATGKAVDALLNYETVKQVCVHISLHMGTYM
jgi:ABC-type transport system involved in Fe-S cluster assembly fused permease/ATPase subunit